MTDVPFETQLRRRASMAVAEGHWDQVAELVSQGLRWPKMLREAPPVLEAAVSTDRDALVRLLREGLDWSTYQQTLRRVEPYGLAITRLPPAEAEARIEAWAQAGVRVPPIAADHEATAYANPLHALNKRAAEWAPATFERLWAVLVSAGADPQGRTLPVNAFTDAYALARRPTAEGVRERGPHRRRP